MDNTALEQATDKVGGRFRLTVLVQRRLQELKRGAPRLVEGMDQADPVDVILQEILQDKISFELEPSEGAPAAEAE